MSNLLEKKLILLMVQKSGNHRLLDLKILVTKWDFNYQPQLVQDFFHQPTYFIFDAKCIGKYFIHLWILWLKECVI